MKTSFRRGIQNIVTVSLFFAPLFVFAQAAPYTQTQYATNVTEKTATLNGQVNPNQTVDTYGWFEWGLANRAETVYETDRRMIGTGNTLLATSAYLSGLAPNTQYFFRVVAENNRGKYTGGTYYFQTRDIAKKIEPFPIAQTQSIAGVTDTSATFEGYVSPMGSTNGMYWFEYGSPTKLENATPKFSVGYDSQQVKYTVSTLAPGTTYAARLVAEGLGGRSNGVVMNFTTTGKQGAGVTSGSSAGSAGSADAPVVIPTYTYSGGAPAGNTPSTSASNTDGATQIQFSPDLIVRSLAVGSRGNDVKALQQYLIRKGFLAEGNSTGYFGPLTETGVKKFQKANNFEQVGFVGPKTRAAIKAEP